jgi:hypothetical protein
LPGELHIESLEILLSVSTGREPQSNTNIIITSVLWSIKNGSKLEALQIAEAVIAESGEEWINVGLI